MVESSVSQTEEASKEPVVQEEIIPIPERIKEPEPIVPVVEIPEPIKEEPVVPVAELPKASKTVVVQKRTVPRKVEKKEEER